MKIRLFVLSFFLLSTVAVAGSIESFSVFRTVYQPEMPELVVPTLVKVTFPSLGFPSVQDLGIAVVDLDSAEPQPWRSFAEYSKPLLEVADTSTLIGPASALVDDDYRTVAEFDLDNDDGVAYMLLQSSEAINASYLYLSLDDFVSLPYKFALSAKVAGEWKTIIAKDKLYSDRISFPATISNQWKLEFWHSQPLRLRGIDLFGEKDLISGKSFVWLARPNVNYKIYSDAEASSNLKVGEDPDLYPEKDEQILAVTLGDLVENPLYSAPDKDEDGISNKLDNCVYIKNLDQNDLDADGVGDACEDYDRDGILTALDNCPDSANKYQEDDDGDGIGNVCDDEESRLTEKNPWLPWVTMGFVAIILIVVMAHTLKNRKS